MSPAADARARIESAYRARTARSAALYGAARDVFPGGVTRSVTFHEPYPTYMAEGRGCRLIDADGNEYLDLVNNFSAMIHGHAHPALTAAMSAQAARGTDLGSPTELHAALACELRRRVPSMERLRLANSGTEAVLYAVRAARRVHAQTENSQDGRRIPRRIRCHARERHPRR